MKRNLKILFGCFVVCALVFCSSCGLFGKNPKESGKSANAEFEEYKRIVTAVVEKTVGKSNENALSADSEKGNSKIVSLSLSKSEYDSVVECFEDGEIIERGDSSSLYQDLYEQSFYVPLVFGEAISEYQNAESFYGVRIQSPWAGQYTVTYSEQNLKTTYVYTDSESEVFNGKEVFAVMNLEYNGENDFNYTVVQFPADYSTCLIAYGNSELEMFSIVISPGNGSYAYYVKNGVSYGVLGEKVESAYELVKHEVTNVDINALRNIKKNCSYTVTQEQYSEVSAKYFNNQQNHVNGELYIENGVCYGWRGDTDKCPTVVEIPETVTALWVDFSLPEQVEKLVIPKSVKSVKGQDNNGLIIEMAPSELRISLDKGAFLKEIEVEKDCSIFNLERNCLTDKNGKVIYVPNDQEVTKFIFDNGVTTHALLIFNSVTFEKLKDIDYTLSYVEEENGNLRTEGDVIQYFNFSNYSLNSVTVRNIAGNKDDSGYYHYSFTVNGEVKTCNLYGAGDLCLELDCYSEKSLTNVNLYGDIRNLDLRAYSAVSLTLPASVKKVSGMVEQLNLPWSHIEFYKNHLKDFAINEIEWLENATLYDQSVEYQATVYNFKEYSAEELKEVKILSEFKDYQITEENGEQVVYLRNYYGSDSVVTLPETYLGYPVYSYEFNQYLNSASFIETLVIPASLRSFSVSTVCNVNKIIYKGTVEQFNEISQNAVELIARGLVGEIECSDGYVQTQAKQEKLIYSSEEESLTLALHANYEEKSYHAILQGNGFTLENHIIYSSNTGMTLNGDNRSYAISIYQYYSNEEYKNVIEISLNELILNDNGEIQTEREITVDLISVEESDMVIAHDNEVLKVSQPTCYTGGNTGVYCSVCEGYMGIQDEVPPLSHLYDEHHYCTRKGCRYNPYLTYSAKYDSAMQRFTWFVKPNESYFSNYSGNLVDIYIPSVHTGAYDTNEYPVKIEDYAFTDVCGIGSVEIEKDVLIGVKALYDCSDLKEVILHSGSIPLKDIVSTNVETVRIAEGVTTINNFMFNNFKGLKNLYLPSTVTSIPVNETVDYQYSFAFIGCRIENVYMAQNDYYYVKNNCLIEKAEKRLIVTFNTQLNLPANEVEILGNFSLVNCEGEVVIPSGVKKIEKDIFLSDNRAVTKIILPNTLTYIEEYGLGYLSGVKEFVFEGTMEEWQSLISGKQWWSSTVCGFSTVKCSNGEVAV